MFLIRIGQKLILPLMIIVVIMLIIMLQMGFVFLLLALLPSIAAYFVDTDGDRANFRTIFACNLAATIPSITPVFISGLKFKHYEVGGMIANPQIWLFIYGGALLGWGGIYFARHIARIVLEIQYRLRIIALERSQAKILEEWGDNVKQVVGEKK